MYTQPCSTYHISESTLTLKDSVAWWVHFLYGRILWRVLTFVDNRLYIPDNLSTLKQNYQYNIKAQCEMSVCPVLLLFSVKCKVERIECSSAFMFSIHDGDSTKKGVLSCTQLSEHHSYTFLSCSSDSLSGKTTYTPWLSLCLPLL